HQELEQSSARCDVLGAIWIHVECPAIPGHPLGLDFEALRIQVALAADGDRSADWNHAFLQPRSLSPGWRCQRDIPYLTVGFDFHRRMRSGEADRCFNCAGEFELFRSVTSPAVMGPGRKHSDCKRQHGTDHPQTES